jgi:hypothetical protein
MLLPVDLCNKAGDGLTACKSRGCLEISKIEMEFLEQVGLANGADYIILIDLHLNWFTSRLLGSRETKAPV